MEEAHASILCTQYYVVKHAENVDQLEVLMHHADVQRGRVVGAGYVYFLTILLYNTGLGLEHSEQYAHQR